MISLILSIIVVSVVAALLIPVTFSFNSVRSGGKIEGNFSISWIIFLLRYTLREGRSELFVFGKGIFRHKASEVKPPVSLKTTRKPGKMPRLGDIIGLAGPMLRLLKDLVHTLRLKYLDIELTFGLDDPAGTGILNGVMHALGLSRTGIVRWTPHFTGPVLDWNIKARVAVSLIRLFPPLARFVSNGKVLRSIIRIAR